MRHTSSLQQGYDLGSNPSEGIFIYKNDRIDESQSEGIFIYHLSVPRFEFPVLPVMPVLNLERARKQTPLLINL